MEQLRQQQNRALQALTNAAPEYRQLPKVRSPSAKEQITQLAAMMESW